MPNSLSRRGILKAVQKNHPLGGCHFPDEVKTAEIIYPLCFRLF
jgi:hypothetical protein